MTRPANPFWTIVSEYAEQMTLDDTVASKYAGHGRLTFMAKWFQALSLIVAGKPWSVSIRTVADVLGCDLATAAAVRVILTQDAVIRHEGTHQPTRVKAYVFAATIPDCQPPVPVDPHWRPIVQDGPVPILGRRRFDLADLAVSNN